MKYNVVWEWTIHGSHIIEADSEKEAKDKFENLDSEQILKGCHDTNLKLIEVEKA